MIIWDPEWIMMLQVIGAQLWHIALMVQGQFAFESRLMLCGRVFFAKRNVIFSPLDSFLVGQAKMGIHT